jgi:hypothetical protein
LFQDTRKLMDPSALFWNIVTRCAVQCYVVLSCAAQTSQRPPRLRCIKTNDQGFLEDGKSTNPTENKKTKKQNVQAVRPFKNLRK